MGEEKRRGQERKVKGTRAGAGRKKEKEHGIEKKKRPRGRQKERQTDGGSG